MLDINVKTIDGQNRSFSVPDNYTVKQFKEKIATSLLIPVDRQRLIFQGRELKDASALNEFDVNGKTLHLVQRVPPNPAGGQSSSTSSRVRANTTDSASASTQNIGGGGGSTRTTGGHRHPPPPDVQNLIQHLLGGLGEFGQNATFTTTTTDGDGGSSGVEVNIDLGNVSQIVNENEIRSRVRNIRRFLTMIDARLNRLGEIQSGAPLDDNSSSTIVVGSIQTTTTALSDGTNIIGFDTSLNPIAAGILADGAASIIHNMQQRNNNNNDGSNERNIDEAVSREAASQATSSSSSRPSTTTTESQQQQEETTTTTTEEQQPRQQPQNIRVEVLADLVQNSINSCTRFVPFLQQYHDMLINDANEPPDSPTPTNATTSSFTRFSNNQSQQAAAESTQSETSGNSTATPAAPAESAAGTTSTTTADNRRQRFCNNINDAMHLLGHLFHNLSDLHISVRDQPPRQIHTVNSMSQHHRANNNLAGFGTGVSGNPTAALITTSSIPIEATFQLPVMSFSTNTPSATTTTTTNTTTSTTTTGSNGSTAPPQMPPPPPQPQQVGATINAPIFIRRRPRSTQSFTSPSSSSSQQQQQGGRPMMGPHMAGNLPFLPPFFGAPPPPPPMMRGGAAGSFNPLSTNNSYDQYLPCSSVHFYNSFQQPNSSNLLNQRRRHPAGDNIQASGGSRGGSSQPQQQQQQHRPRVATASATGPRVNVINATAAGGGPLGGEDQDLARLISNIVASTIRNSENGGGGTTTTGPAGQQIRVNIGGMPGQISIATISTTHGVGGHQQQPGMANTPNSTPLNSSSRASPTGSQNLFPGDMFSQLGSLLFPGGGAGAQPNNSNQQQSTAGNPLNSMINQLVGNLMGGLGNRAAAGPASRPTTAPPASTNTSGSSRASANQAAALDSILREALNLMDMDPSNTNDAQRQRFNQPVRNFFSMFDTDMEQSDSVDPTNPTLNIFNAFFSALSVGDMINLARGGGGSGENVLTSLAEGENNLRVYERARQPLRDYIRRALPHINGTTLSDDNTTTPSDSDLRAFASRLYSDLIEDTRHGLGVDLTRFDLIDTNVNFPHTLRSCLTHHFHSLAQQIFADDVRVETGEWAREFGRRLASLISQTVGVCRRCARNADARLTEIILEKLRETMASESFIGGSLAAIYQVFEGYARTQLESVLRSVGSSSTSDLDRFMVYVTSTTTNTTTTTEVETATTARSSSLVSSGSDDQDQYDSASSTISNHSNRIDSSKMLKRKKEQQESTAAVVDQRPSSSVSTTAVGATSSGDFPSEWRAVIEHDQRVQQQQSSNIDSISYSDAYMSGMPAKKRKILAGAGGELSSSTLFKTVLDRTLKQVKLRPSVSQQDILETSDSQYELISEFDQEIDTALTERLRSDADFLSAIKHDEKGGDEKDGGDTTVVYNKSRFELSRKRLN